MFTGSYDQLKIRLALRLFRRYSREDRKRPARREMPGRTSTERTILPGIVRYKNQVENDVLAKFLPPCQCLKKTRMITMIRNSTRPMLTMIRIPFRPGLGTLIGVMNKIPVASATGK